MKLVFLYTIISRCTANKTLKFAVHYLQCCAAVHYLQCCAAVHYLQCCAAVHCLQCCAAVHCLQCCAAVHCLQCCAAVQSVTSRRKDSPVSILTPVTREFNTVKYLTPKLHLLPRFHPSEFKYYSHGIIPSVV